MTEKVAWDTLGFTMNTLSRERLDEIYEVWNKPEYISPDPLETLSPYSDVRDRETAGLAAACMAYGRVSSLLPPLQRVLAVMGESPADYARNRSAEQISGDLDGIVHRFAKPSHLTALISGMGGVLNRFGSLEAAFLKGYCAAAASLPLPEKSTLQTAPAVRGLESLTTALLSAAAGSPGHLLPNPARGSACKRLLLFLRWMVRRDLVDPGGWDSVHTARLLLPLDTWTRRIALRAGWTSRKASDMKTVLDITASLAACHPEDPVRYDFALSRFGIRNSLNVDMLFR